MGELNITVIIKLEPDFSEGNVSYNHQVPESGESPACVHCGFGTGFDDRCLPLVVRQPGGVAKFWRGQVFFFRRTKNENNEAQSDTAESKQEYRFKTDEAPALFAIEDSLRRFVGIDVDGNGFAATINATQMAAHVLLIVANIVCPARYADPVIAVLSPAEFVGVVGVCFVGIGVIAGVRLVACAM